MAMEREDNGPSWQEGQPLAKEADLAGVRECGLFSRSADLRSDRGGAGGLSTIENEVAVPKAALLGGS
jgi:hypothetical protein